MKKKKSIAIIVISILFLLGVGLYYNNSTASAAATEVRLWGATRYETAIKVSQEGWKTSNTVIIVCGSDYPDALSAAPLAKYYGAPILLSEKSELNSKVSQEISRLNAKNVIIVGGTSVISSNVETQLRNKGLSVQRLAGATRYETAVKVAEKLGTTNGIVLASGTSFADALSIAPIAAQKGMPILLTQKDSISTENANFISKYNISTTYVIGGVNVISDSNMSRYPGARRISGDDRYATNIKILDTFASSIETSKLYVALGSNFPDGLVGAPIAAQTNSPIILIEESGNYYPKVLDRITGINSNQVYILGGTTVIGESIVTKIIDAVDSKGTFRVLSIE